MDYNNQYTYTRPPANTQGYPPYPPQYSPPPQIVPVPVQENGVPVTPLPEERSWIKHFYNWVGGFLLIHIGIAIAISVLIGIVGAVIMLSGSSGNLFSAYRTRSGLFSIVTALATVVAYMAANLTVFGVGCKVTKVKPKSLFNFNGFSGTFILASIAVALFIQTLAIIAQNLGISLIQVTTGVDIYSLVEKLTQDKTVNIPSEIIMTFYVCIGAPITEELLFRGFCLKNLSRFNQRFGIIASAFLFALMHANIAQFILAFPLGILLAYITVKANSIIPAIIVHFTVNTSATLFSKISEINEKIGEIAALIWYISIAIIGLAVLIIALVKYKVRLPKNTVPKKKRSWPLYFSSAPLIIYTCLYGICIILPLFAIPFLPMLVPIINAMY